MELHSPTYSPTSHLLSHLSIDTMISIPNTDINIIIAVRHIMNDDLSLSSSSSSSASADAIISLRDGDGEVLVLAPSVYDYDDDDDDDHDINHHTAEEAEEADDDDNDSLSDSSFNGYAALAKMEEEDFEDLHDIQEIAKHMKEKWRKHKKFYPRKDYGGYEDLLVSNDTFYKRFRMPKEHFDYLLDAIRDCITVDVMKSMNSTRGNTPLHPEVVAAIGLQALGQGLNTGGLADIFGFSDSTIARARKMFMDAIDFNTTCKQLQVCLPDASNVDALHELAGKWQDVSTAFGLLNGFVGAIDGWLPRTKRPAGVDNPADYFSGHYQCYGLNVQAMCDPDLLFLYVAIAAPGKVNDIRAFGRCTDLLQWLEDLPHEYFIGGDNAYPLSRRVLIPFSGGQVHNETNRTYNFYLSQLRIRIEMAFGVLTQKWVAVADTMKQSNKTNAQIISVCTKLHNFCIRMKQKDEHKAQRTRRSGRMVQMGGTCNLSFLGVDPNNVDEDGNIVNPTSAHFSTADATEDADEDTRILESLVSSSQFSTLTADLTRRQAIVDNLASRGLERPAANKIRNKSHTTSSTE